MAGEDRKFLRHMPDVGDKISKKNVVRGLRQMATALGNLSVHKGHVDWGPWGLNPKIIFDGAGEGGGLPSTSGKSRYMVLALDSGLDYDWDDPRIRIES